MRVSVTTLIRGMSMTKIWKAVQIHKETCLGINNRLKTSPTLYLPPNTETINVIEIDKEVKVTNQDTLH